MNQRPSVSASSAATVSRGKKARSVGLTIDRAIPGFVQFKTAEGLSPRTIAGYQRHLEVWLEYYQDEDIGAVNAEALRNYLNYMRLEYTPRRITGKNEEKLSSKTIRNIYITLKAFFHWASDEFQINNPMQSIPAPKFSEPPVEPLSKEDIDALLKACDYCEEAKTKDRRKFAMRRPTVKRDKALILVLLDTGLRASELCALKIGDLDTKTGKITVKHGAKGGAKGSKGRTVYLGKATRRCVWRYLVDREDGEDETAPLFVSKSNHPLNKDALRQLINALGTKAGVKKCYPHRFRHTFAITYLRSGGDVFTLQMLLGHGSLDMVKRYARIAEIDVENVHRKASPVDNWRL